MTQFPESAGEVGLQLARGNLLHITDKWHHKYFDTDAMGMSRDRQPGDPVPTPILRVEPGGPEVRRRNLLFAGKLNDIQRGEFNLYFTRGRSGRFPLAYAQRGADTQWSRLQLHDRRPAVGTLKHPAKSSLLYVCVNGESRVAPIRLQKPKDMIQSRSRHEKPATEIEWQDASFVQLDMQPYEIAIIEWQAGTP